MKCESRTIRVSSASFTREHAKNNYFATSIAHGKRLSRMSDVRRHADVTYGSRCLGDGGPRASCAARFLGFFADSRELQSSLVRGPEYPGCQSVGMVRHAALRHRP